MKEESLLLPRVAAHHGVVQADAQAGPVGNHQLAILDELMIADKAVPERQVREVLLHRQNTRTSTQGGLRVSTEPTLVIVMDGWIGTVQTGAADGW